MTTLRNDPRTAIAEAAAALQPGLVAIRRDLHAHPELAFEEVRTAGLVAAELTRLGIAHRTGVGRTGVVGTLEGARPGPTLVIRADMDALPIAERTSLAFASSEPGKMHACGHDIHTATLLGVASVLQGLCSQLAGTVRLVFQPAEETLGGAAAMMEEGVLDGVDMALGFHNYPGLPVGEFGWCRGSALAASDRFEIAVRGRSGHAAHPDGAVDPVVAACALVGQMQTVVSREVDPIHPAVVSVTAIHGGQAFNIIPDEVVIRGTVRTLHAPAQDIAEAAIGRLCAGLGTGMRVEVALDYQRGVPALVNDDGVLDRTIAAVRLQCGAEHVHQRAPSLGGEDFAFMLQKVRGCQVGIGSGAPGRRDSLHNSDYQPDEGCIAMGVEALSRAALELLS